MSRKLGRPVHTTSARTASSRAAGARRRACPVVTDGVAWLRDDARGDRATGDELRERDDPTERDENRLRRVEQCIGVEQRAPASEHLRQRPHQVLCARHFGHIAGAQDESIAALPEAQVRRDLLSSDLLESAPDTSPAGPSHPGAASRADRGAGARPNEHLLERTADERIAEKTNGGLVRPDDALLPHDEEHVGNASNTSRSKSPTRPPTGSQNCSACGELPLPRLVPALSVALVGKAPCRRVPRVGSAPARARDWPRSVDRLARSRQGEDAESGSSPNSSATRARTAAGTGFGRARAQRAASSIELTASLQNAFFQPSSSDLRSSERIRSRWSWRHHMPLGNVARSG